jgi:hypothetical protein
MYPYDRRERSASDGSVGAKVSAQIICASKADKDGDGHGDRHAAVEHAVTGASSCLLSSRLRGSDCRHLRFPQREAFYQGAGGWPLLPTTPVICGSGQAGHTFFVTELLGRDLYQPRRVSNRQIVTASATKRY